MIQKILIVSILLCGIQSFGQFQGLWYLHVYENQNGDVTFTNNVTPYIAPILDVDSQGNFTGTGACNFFEGKFSYDTSTSTTFLENFTLTSNEICSSQSQIEFENDYFFHFDNSILEPIDVGVIFFNGYEELHIIFPNDVYYIYGESPLLKLDDSRILQASLFPNPAENSFSVASALPIETINIYGIAGNLLFSEENSGESINISTLQAGIYFVEVLSGNNRNVQKLIKK